VHIDWKCEIATDIAIEVGGGSLKFILRYILGNVYADSRSGGVSL
jgi:hypothetical protein